MIAGNSFGTKAELKVGGRTFEVFRLDGLERRGMPIARLPYSLKLLLENLLRREDGRTVRAAEIERLARWDAKRTPEDEIAFMPARVLLQDFTGVPAVVDLASMRDAMQAMGGDPKRVNPLLPAELVIDHSVIVDQFGTPLAFQVNADLEFQRNRERYALLRWAQQAFQGFRVVPPDTGIVHQVNLEYLARVVFTSLDASPDAKSPGRQGSIPQAYPDTLVGTDSHTTMINGLGVLGWGVGGIEAEAAMLGQPVSMLIPQVVGFRLTGRLPEGATATDLVLTVTEMLRKKGVVGKFVEFYGPGVAALPVADRATIGNMAPEYGATVGLFPVDEETLRYLTFTGRPKEQIALVEAYMKEQGLFGAGGASVEYSDTLELDLAKVEPSLAGPRRPQDRVPLRDVKQQFLAALPTLVKPTSPIGPPTSPNAVRWEEEGGQVATQVEAPPQRRTHVDLTIDGVGHELRHGSVVIAAITSCTNTSNPSVMEAAGLVAKKAVEQGLRTEPWVKTSLAPGSKVVTDYLRQAGLLPYLEQLGFHLVGYGCTTCIGNSGPLPDPVSAAIAEGELVTCAVLSGNRNFEGRIQQEVRANYLASPPLVVAYALAGRIDLDLEREPLGTGKDGVPVYLRDVWPSPGEVDALIRSSHPPCALLRRDPSDTGADRGHPRRARLVPARRQHHDRSHLARRLDPQDEPSGPASDRARRRARRFQFLRLAARQPRGHGARHVRQCAPEESARPRHGRAVYGPCPRRGAADDLRRLGQIPRRGDAAAGHRRQGVWRRVVTRLGCEGPAAARRARRDRPELRADPSLKPRGHGHPTAAIRRGSGRRGARALRYRAL